MLNESSNIFERIILLNFSHIYEQQKSLLSEPNIKIIDMSDITGTNCYCDQEAQKQIRERLESEQLNGIHFIDSGNYHYLSRIWTEMINEPFQLIVFDHHTDMQLPAFGGLLSCGGWIADTFDCVEMLKNVILVGPPAEDYAQVEEHYKAKTHHFDEMDIINENMEISFEAIVGALDPNLPVYISIDKDILDLESAKTNWSQGMIHLEQLISCIERLIRILNEWSIPILGVDICGECAADEEDSLCLNERANMEILNVLNMRK